MAIVATERWSVRNRFSMGSEFLQARREWDVTGADTERKAIYAGGVARIGERHIRWPDLKCVRVETVQQNSTDVWVIGVTYDNRPGQPENPVERREQRPMRIQWLTSLVEEEIEHDVDSWPITNSAGQPFERPVLETMNQLQLVVKRWEPFFDPRFAMSRMNRTNKDSFSIVVGLGTARVDPGQAKILRIQPTSEYFVDEEFVEVEYVFEFREYGWKRRLLDNGTEKRLATELRGGKTVPITNKDQETQVGSPVRLDGTGLPLNESLRRSGEKGAGKPLGAEVDDNNQHAVFLKWTTLEEINFSGIL